jgi:hypothetical protein
MQGEPASRIDARGHLTSLVGQVIPTATYRRPNQILSVSADAVLVGTGKSPQGQVVPLVDVQSAFDRLYAGEEVRVSVASLGYRSAFVGAAMLSLPGAILELRPTRVRLESRRQGGD